MFFIYLLLGRFYYMIHYVGTCYPLGDAGGEVDVSWWIRGVVALVQVL